jgi:uncharacterized Fe-S center protein
MSSIVYYGSPRQAQLKAEETLPAKLDLIIEKLKIRERVKDETVALKLHLGNNIGYSVIHPVFVRKIVQAVKEGVGIREYQLEDVLPVKEKAFGSMGYIPADS